MFCVNKCLSLYLEIENMGNRQIKVVMMDEALAFFRLLPQKVQEKISYNFLKIEQGVIDKELFKKLVGTNIWEFRTLVQWQLL